MSQKGQRKIWRKKNWRLQFPPESAGKTVAGACFETFALRPEELAQWKWEDPLLPDNKWRAMRCTSIERLRAYFS